MKCSLQKLYYISIYISYILFISRQVQKSRNDVNPTSTSGDTYKTIFIILFKLFSIGDLFKFNRNMSKSKGWTLQSSLLMLRMDENSNQQSN